MKKTTASRAEGQASAAEAATPVPSAFASFRRFPLDGALLLFDRQTGTNVLVDGAETVALRQRAPRAIQFGITNACNLMCTFCSRPEHAESLWTVDTAYAWLAELADEGVLEVAFGGGEPLAFAGFAKLVTRLHDETPLAVHVTTNGILLTDEMLATLRRACGEIRLSLYDDNNWRTTVARLAAKDVRFGVNYLLTPDRLPALETTILELAALGCRDVLLLSYNGSDPRLHLTAAHDRELSRRVDALSRAIQPHCVLKLDVCFGMRLDALPRLFDRRDCGAGRDFLVLTSDRRVMACSFHDAAIPVASPAEVLHVWREAHDGPLARASRIRGCAREEVSP